MNINYQYTKFRRDCGRQPLFCLKGPELCDSIIPDKMLQKSYMLRNPVNQNIQHGPIYSQVEINTIRVKHARTGINHSEGGWPKDVNILDPEATQRYRRKIEKDEDYIHCVMTMTPEMEHYVKQNNAIDMYEAYYSTMIKIPPLEHAGSRTVNVFSNPSDTRSVSSICWRPDEGHHFASSYVNMDINHKPIGILCAYIWDVDHASEPLTTFNPPDSMLDLQYNPRDINMLVGGLANGQVICFDQRAMSKPTIKSDFFKSTQENKCISPAFTSHRDLVRKVNFINSKSSTQFFSGSSDGTLKWWDTRKMEEPTDEQIIDFVDTPADEPNMVRANGICTIQYESTLPTRYMVGTENGLIISGNRKGKTSTEKLPARYRAHNGTIKSLERNPQFLKNFLTVGDWTMKIWSEECRESCIICTPQQRICITSATWSPTRASIISATTANGRYTVWDMLRRQHEPIFTQQVCPEPLLKISAHQGGQLVASGSKLGKVYLIELTPAISDSDKNEKVLMGAVLERESKREKIIESRLREIRLKVRQAEEGDHGSPKASVADLTIGDKDLIDATHDYMMQVKKEQEVTY